VRESEGHSYGLRLCGRGESTKKKGPRGRDGSEWRVTEAEQAQAMRRVFQIRAAAVTRGRAKGGENAKEAGGGGGGGGGGRKRKRKRKRERKETAALLSLSALSALSDAARKGCQSHSGTRCRQGRQRSAPETKKRRKERMTRKTTAASLPLFPTHSCCVLQRDRRSGCGAARRSGRAAVRAAQEKARAKAAIAARERERKRRKERERERERAAAAKREGDGKKYKKKKKTPSGLNHRAWKRSRRK